MVEEYARLPLDPCRMLVCKPSYFYKGTKRNEAKESYLRFACLNVLRIEITTFKLTEPQFHWRSLVTIWSTQDHSHLQMLDALSRLCGTMI